MSISVIAAIQAASESLPSLTPADKRVLVAHIHRYLEDYRRDVLGDLPDRRCSWMLRLIEAVSSKARGIVEADAREFRSIMVEFEKLLTMLDGLRLSQNWSEQPITLH